VRVHYRRRSRHSLGNYLSICIQAVSLQGPYTFWHTHKPVSPCRGRSASYRTGWYTRSPPRCPLYKPFWSLWAVLAGDIVTPRWYPGSSGPQIHQPVSSFWAFERKIYLRSPLAGQLEHWQILLKAREFASAITRVFSGVMLCFLDCTRINMKKVLYISDAHGEKSTLISKIIKNLFFRVVRNLFEIFSGRKCYCLGQSIDIFGRSFRSNTFLRQKTH
jgi:hypothetical protein